ncbi:hypothetical protein GCK32_014158 [Trichostrongylus colubriformis]|uniref:Uncharacterized protein n=1 Tax=Trichostrongylus colubriformis TaxID=6319 RepID=A0AAN8FCF8_TRICO
MEQQSIQKPVNYILSKEYGRCLTKSQAQRNVGRIRPTYSSTALALTRPHGMIFNLQTPDGGRGRFAVLSDGSHNSPLTSYTSLSNSITKPLLNPLEQINAYTSTESFQTCCSNSVCFHHSKCDTMQSNGKNSYFDGVPASWQPTACSATTENETSWLPSSQGSPLSQCTRRNENSKEEYSCQRLGYQRIDALPSPPLSGEQSPDGYNSATAGIPASVSQPHYPSNITPPIEGCTQENEIDYSLFDEFFVRT